MNQILKIILDLLEFLLKQANRHNLDEISIPVPRARLICHQIRDALKKSERAYGKI